MVVVISVLAGVAVFAVAGVGDRGRSAAYAADAATLRSAEEAYFGVHGHYATEAELVRNGFASEQSSLHEVEVAEPPLSYRITCRIGPGCGAGGAIVRGGSLTVAVSDLEAEGGILNPAVTTNEAVHANAEPFFNGLVHLAADGTPTPELAESWAFPDDLTAVFTLRPGVVWHDGSPVTAADVKFSFDAALLRYHARTAGSLGPALGVTPDADPDLTQVPSGAITLPDGEAGRRVQFNLVYPYPTLIRQLGVTEAAIIPRAIYDDCAAAGTLDDTVTDETASPPTRICAENLAPVGSGPFRFAGLDEARGELRTTANPSYLRPGLPFLDRLVLRELPPDLLTSALLAPRADPGSVDWVFGVPGADLASGARLATNPAVRIATSARGPGGSNCAVSLAFNLWGRGTTASQLAARPPGAPYEHPMLRNPAVRAAIASAVNRQNSLNEIELGQGQMSASPYHHALAPAFAPQALRAFAPDEARSLLQGAGWIDPSNGADTTTVRQSDGRAGLPPAGTPLRLDNVHLASGVQVDYAAQLVDDLRQVGIEVVGVPSVEPTQAIFVDRDFDTAWTAYCHGPDPVLGVRRQYHADAISAAPFSNAAGYRNPAMDLLWDQAALAVGGSEAYRDLHRRIQELAVADLPYVWVLDTVHVIGYRAQCQGFDPDSTSTFAEGAWCTEAAG